MQNGEVAGQIQAAMSAHGMWKARLRTAIDQGTSEFDVATVRKDNQCQFGKWLHEEITSSARLTPEYERVKDLHAKFHLAAASVLEMAVSGRKAEAEAAMSLTSDFAHISSELTQALMRWKADC